MFRALDGLKDGRIEFVHRYRRGNLGYVRIAAPENTNDGKATRCASSRSFRPSTGRSPSRVRVPWSRALRMSMSLGLCLPNERVSTDNFASNGSFPDGSYFRNGLRYDFNGFAPWRRDRFSNRYRLRTRRRSLQRIGHHPHFRNQAACRHKTNSPPGGFYPNGGVGESPVGCFLSVGRAVLAWTTDGNSPGGFIVFIERVTAGTGTIGLRLAAAEFATSLVTRFSRPVTATSANRSTWVRP